MNEVCSLLNIEDQKLEDKPVDGVDIEVRMPSLLAYMTTSAQGMRILSFRADLLL
jgi:hypothetical protein